MTDSVCRWRRPQSSAMERRESSIQHRITRGDEGGAQQQYILYGIRQSQHQSLLWR